MGPTNDRTTALAVQSASDLLAAKLNEFYRLRVYDYA